MAGYNRERTSGYEVVTAEGHQLDVVEARSRVAWPPPRAPRNSSSALEREPWQVANRYGEFYGGPNLSATVSGQF